MRLQTLKEMLASPTDSVKMTTSGDQLMKTEGVTLKTTKLQNALERISEIMPETIQQLNMSKYFEKTFTINKLKLKTFQCDLCKNLLNIPVRQVEDIGSICNTCYVGNEAKHSSWNSMGNPKLDEILSNSILPCPNQGCFEERLFDDLEVHQKLCEHRSLKCPLKTCVWSGNRDSLIEHFPNTHKEHILSDQTFEISIINEFKYESVVKMICLLEETQWYFLKVKVDENDSILCSLIQVFNCDKVIATVNSQIEGWKIVKELEVLPFDSIDKAEGTLLNLKALSKETVSLIINLKLPSISKEHENIKSLMECPVCQEVMKPPIYQCKIGHSICNRCKEKILVCPMCQNQLNNDIRNYALEAISGTFSYPCIYKSFGCKKIVQGNNREHEKRCDRKPYSCPFKHCAFNNVQGKLEIHLKMIHASNILINDNFSRSLLQYTKRYQEKIIITSGCIFSVKIWKDLNEYYSSVTNLCKNNNTEFEIVVGVKKKKK